MITHAFTLRQPSAHYVAMGSLTITNQRRPTSFRGLLAVHASRNEERVSHEHRDRFRSMAFGAVIGVVELWAVHSLRDLPMPWRDDPFANGPICWLLRGARRLQTPIPCRGELSVWQLPPDIAHRVTVEITAQLANEERVPE